MMELFELVPESYKKMVFFYRNILKNPYKVKKGPLWGSKFHIENLYVGPRLGIDPI